MISFSQSNCGRGCPISGHLEVSATASAPWWGWEVPEDNWKAEPFLLLYAEGENGETDARDEL